MRALRAVKPALLRGDQECKANLGYTERSRLAQAR